MFYNDYQSISEEEKLGDALGAVLCVEYLFGRCTSNLIFQFFAKTVFFCVFLFTLAVFMLGVFHRGDSIEMWTQLSLYIIPLLAFPCGAKIFSSHGYNRLINRNTTDSFMVRFFVHSDGFEANMQKPSAHNRNWLRSMSVKSLLFPLSLELIQWAGFMTFSMMNGQYSAEAFIGKVGHIDDTLWVVMYCCYWVLSIYLLGFVSFQFVFVTRIIVKDTVTFMSLFGKTSLLRLVPVYEFTAKKNIFVRILKLIIDFLTMDLLDCNRDENVYTNCTHVTRKKNIPSSYIPVDIPYRAFSAKHLPDEINGKCPHLQSQQNELENKAESVEEPSNSLSPSEASEIFATFISEVEEMTSSFTLFTVIITFFGVANLGTHICLFIRKDTHYLSYWTLFRTIIFLLIAVRMLLCVHHVTTVLGKLLNHVKFLHTFGKLGYKDASSPDWKNFFELLDSFNLGKRSFGFPLTLRQVASIATFLNMSFLIVMSVFNSKGGGMLFR